MKKTLLGFLILAGLVVTHVLTVPHAEAVLYSKTWRATTTTPNLIFPIPIGAVYPSLLAPTFIATSTTATSTFPRLSSSLLGSFQDLLATGTTTLATTTTSMLNGVIVVGSGNYPATGAGIQVALDVAFARGHGECVFVPSGDYTNATSTIFYSRSCLIGASASSTSLTGTGNVPTIQTYKQGTSKTVYSDIVIKNITVKASFNGLGAHIIRMDNIDGLTIESSRFEHTSTPLSGTPESLYVEHSQNVDIKGNTIFNVAGNGIQVNGVDHFRIIDNHVASTSDDGIDVDMDFIDTDTVPSRFGVVSGNTIDRVKGGNGIRVENSNYIDVVGNTITNVETDSASCITANTSAGVVGDPLLYAHDVNIIGNVIFNCDGDGISTSGGGEVYRILIANNTIASTSLATGSDIKGGIQIATASTTVRGNIISDVAKTNGDSGGIVIYRFDDITVSGNEITNASKGINLWNEGFVNNYTGITVEQNKFFNVTTPYYGASSSWLQPGVFLSTVLFDSTGSNPHWGIGTTSPSTILSIAGSTGIFASTTATSTFLGGGINLVTAAGNIPCFAVNGTCLGGGGGTVTSVAASVPSVLSISGSPVTTSGTLAITYSGTALPVLNGGTGLTSFTGNQILYTNSAGTGLASAATSTLSIGGNAATVTTNANLTGPITSTGNATAIAAQTGTGSTFVMDTSPTLVTPILGYASSTQLTTSGATYLATDGSKVGVGTTTPFGRLSIEQNTATHSLWIGNEGSTTPSLVVQGVNGNGTVGIGIAAPLTPLHVYEDTANTNRTAGVLIENDGTGDVRLGLRLTGATEWLVGVDNSDSDSFKIAVGSGIQSLGTPSADRFVITTGGQIAIATTTPWGQLSASSTSAFPALAIEQLGTGAAAIFTGGNTGIGTTTPWRKLSVVGTMAVNGLTGATAGTNNDMCITAAFDVVSETTGGCIVSSRKFKHDIENLDLSGLDLIAKLTPRSFKRNDDDPSASKDKIRYGFIAEEVADADKHLANYGLDGEPRNLDDAALIATLVQAVKELNTKVEKLEITVDQLKENAETVNYSLIHSCRI